MACIGCNANLPFDPASEMFCHLVSELDLLSEGEVSTMLHKLNKTGQSPTHAYTNHAIHAHINLLFRLGGKFLL